MSGPAWLGIGAQRCGTTWLTDLLCAHPRVDVVGGRKELHQLYRGLVEPWDQRRLARYRRRFGGDRLRRGECTPFYLRAPWAADLAARAVPDDAVVFAILRDPVERFESAVRYWLTLRRNPRPVGPGWIRAHGSNAMWGGMYATHLDAWAAVFGRDRLTVLQYEAVRADPQTTVGLLWKQLGLEPVPLRSPEVSSRTSSDQQVWSLDRVAGLRDHLRAAYRREVARLAEWGMDATRWPNFRDP